MNASSTPGASVAPPTDTPAGLGSVSSVSSEVAAKPRRTRRTSAPVPSAALVKSEATTAVPAASGPTEMNAPQDLGADKAFAKGSASMKSQVKEQLGSMNQTLQRTQNSLQNLARGVKNTSVGAMLVFMSNLPQFFEPILFVMANTKTLGKAALHVLAPLALAWYAAQLSPVLRESLFSNPSVGMKMLGSVSLYALASFTWMMGWLFTRSVVSGLSSQLNAFAQVGERQGKIT